MAKRIQVSNDAGTTWYTLPGNTGTLSNEAGPIDDTIFGQEFQSSQTGLIGWTIEANGLYKGFAGYVAKIMKSGTPTAMLAEAMSLVSGKTYQITNVAKRVLNRAVAIVVKDNGVAVAANNIQSYDHLFGRVTFTSGYTPTGPITMDASYLPMASVGKANGFTLTQTANPIDNTTFDEAQANDGHRTFEYGLKQVSLELNGIYASSNGFVDLLRDRTELVIEINPDGDSKSVARGFFKPMNQSQQGDVGALEEETATFELSVPDQANVSTPFKWLHASDTTLSMGVKICLDAWEQKLVVPVRYLPDGTTGVRGDSIITDMTLTSGLEAMNEFTVNFQGTDETVAVP